MPLGLGKKKSEENEYNFSTNDLLIVFNHEKRTSDINLVTEVTDNAVKVDGLYNVPLEDCEITTGKDGRNFFYRAPTQSIVETERLAKLEMNTVLEQITSYKPPILPSSLDWTKGLLIGLIFIALVVLGFAAT
ncbi:hypothetical protein [Paraliobacillus sp. X-1268]|uniref:hypothetical protein n=1 Tax=Paraliobacillus sp. X-1268 TaxID=2213193 RepID=UPI000E3E511A|nr:hypothetical protein [Paraliobacillus sp. X-1268]